MYAVVTTGGKQYRVEAGTTLSVATLEAAPGAPIVFDRVLMIGDGDQVTIGNPTVAGASVRGTILGQELGPKLVIFKFKQKAKYRRRTGHRQHLTRVRIDAIQAQPEPEAVAKPAAKPRRARASTVAAAGK